VDLQWLSPPWVWPALALVALLSVWWAHRCYARAVPAPPPGARRLLVGLRALAVVLAVVAAARPLLVRLQAVQEPATVAVVVDDSGSMALQDRPGGPSRWQRAWTLAAAVDSALAHGDEPVRVVTFRGNGEGELAAVAPAVALADTPRAVGTDLPAMVAAARQRLLAAPLRGVVVLGDGHSESQRSRRTDAGAGELWLAGLGDPDGPADRFLADLRAPDTVLRGEPLTVEVAVGQRWQAAAGDDSVRVALRHRGEVVAEATAPAADLIRRELVWTPPEVGLAVLEVAVSGLDNERFLANNTATLAVDVRKDRAQVLLLAPQPGWDVRFLAQAAAREPRLALRVVRPGPRGPVLADSLTAWSPPADAAAWQEAWDAVVLAGPPSGLLSGRGQSLAAAVREGLGLLVIAGDPGTDQQPRRLPEPLQRLLPVVPSAVAPQPDRATLTAAAAGTRHPVLAGITHGPGTLPGLGGLPPLRRLQAARPAAGAEVLLAAGEGRPVLAAVARQSGRVLWFGGRRLWELAFWQLPARADTGDHPGRRLLRQMLLWTTLGDQAGGVTLLGQKRVYEEGEPVPVAVRWRDLRGEPVTGRRLSVQLNRPDGSERRTVDLRPDATRPGVARGELPALPPGRWRLTPRGDGDPPTVGEPREIVVTAAERERAQVRQDRRNLRLLAARLGGRALDAGDPAGRQALLDGLTDLDLTPEETSRQDRHEPASGWPWFTLAVMALGAEWLLRRRHGLL
jgi:hypothetical protein